uniref:Uncharacterized protein n=1 Tax=Octopus bimaculoides TaxID=37653 RepID=A0A0L8HPG4_OCTBM
MLFPFFGSLVHSKRGSPFVLSMTIVESPPPPPPLSPTPPPHTRTHATFSFFETICENEGNTLNASLLHAVIYIFSVFPFISSTVFVFIFPSLLICSENISLILFCKDSKACHDKQTS